VVIPSYSTSASCIIGGALLRSLLGGGGTSREEKGLGHCLPALTTITTTTTITTFIMTIIHPEPPENSMPRINLKMAVFQSFYSPKNVNSRASPLRLQCVASWLSTVTSFAFQIL